MNASLFALRRCSYSLFAALLLASAAQAAGPVADIPVDAAAAPRVATTAETTPEVPAETAPEAATGDE